MELPESDKEAREARGCISVVTPALHMPSPELGPQHWRKKKLGFKGASREKEEDKIQRNIQNIYLILHFLPKGSDVASRMIIYFMLIITN